MKYSLASGQDLKNNKLKNTSTSAGVVIRLKINKY
jgi:hypothetical protein